MEKKDIDQNIKKHTNPNLNQCDFCEAQYYAKLDVYDWLKDVQDTYPKDEYVEVRFKNTRKEFFKNDNELRLKKGDVVAVEASPGHDIGIVNLTGELVKYQMKKQGSFSKETEFKRIYRKAKQADLEKWQEAISLEHETMIKSREISSDLKLDMKIGDVEYQGDKTKAIFYYIADERVDFRQLIKVLAETFKIRIEMKQIGARQEAGRIGGIGSCGRELCCSSWMSNFVSVTTNSARHQEISLNPQKLAGQCSKLKCCLNYELDCYLDAQKDFPPKDKELRTKNGVAYYLKTDIFRRIMWYSFDQHASVNITAVPVERVKEIIEINDKGKEVDTLIEMGHENRRSLDYQNVVGQESLTRFEDKKPKKKRRKKGKKRRKGDGKN